MPYKYCSDCGECFHYDLGQEWKDLCLKCFKRRKAMERNESDPDSVVVSRVELAKLRQEAGFYKNHYFSLLASQNGYGPTPPPSAGSKILEKLSPLIKDLILLCHPDKHGGNDPRATRATQALLDLRKEVSA